MDSRFIAEADLCLVCEASHVIVQIPKTLGAQWHEGGNFYLSCSKSEGSIWNKIKLFPGELLEPISLALPCQKVSPPQREKGTGDGDGDR